MAKEKLWQRSQQRIYFKDIDMDFYLMWVLGLQTGGGSAAGEVFHTASQIQDGDVNSWAVAWLETARQVETRAQAAAAAGHRASAHQDYLRAFNYYQSATIGLRLSDPRFPETWTRSLACFRQAMPLMDTPIEAVAIPFEGKVLPGYFMRPDTSGQRRKTLIMIGGGETCAEQMYFWSGVPGVVRGYNVLFVDLPGQGSAPEHGLYFRVDYENPIREVVTYALNRPEVDGERLALYGVSGGGYMVSRAATYEHRLKALIANAPIIDFHRLATAEFPPALLKAPAVIGNTVFKFVGAQKTFAAIAMEKFVNQCGLHSLREALDMAQAAQFSERIGEITCPTLCLCGEGESEEQVRQVHEFYDQLRVPKHLRFFTAAEGADAHCQVNNFSLAQQVVFDWLDDTFAN